MVVHMKNFYRFFILLFLLHSPCSLIGESLCLGHITITNPVIAILGATISLVKIGHQLCTNHMDGLIRMETFGFLQALTANDNNNNKT
jgi:hypothetical protein